MKLYDLSVGNKYIDKATGLEKTRWTKIGTMFEHSDGKKSILLDAAPINNQSIAVFERTENNSNVGQAQPNYENQR